MESSSVQLLGRKTLTSLQYLIYNFGLQKFGVQKFELVPLFPGLFQFSVRLHRQVPNNKHLRTVEGRNVFYQEHVNARSDVSALERRISSKSQTRFMRESSILEQIGCIRNGTKN